MDDRNILEALQAATSSQEQAAIIAESAFNRMRPIVGETARKCVAIPWFTSDVIEIFLSGISPEIISEAESTILSLPFVETAPWGGYTFHDLTRQGLLSYYFTTQPTTIMQACQEAAPIFLKTSKESYEAALAALYCLLVGGKIEAAQELLYEVLFLLAEREDWKGIEAVYATVDEVVNLPLTSPLPSSVMQELRRDRKSLAAAFYYRANNYKEEGDLETAITSYTRAITLADDNLQILAQAYNNRGIIFDMQEKHDEAVADYDRALAIPLNDKDFQAQVYNNRGVTQLKNGQIDLALKNFNQAIAMSDIIAAEAYRNRSLVYKEQGNQDEYQADVEVATCWSENHYGNIAYRSGDIEEAIRHYEKAIELSKNINSQRVLRTSMFNLALLHRELDHLDDALNLFTEIVRFDEMAGFADLEQDKQILQELIDRLKITHR